MQLVIDEPPNDLAERLTGRRYLSHSAVTTYQQCPLRYYFRYIARLPEETVSSSLIFGSAIHAALQHYFEAGLSGRSATLEDMIAAYSQEWTDRSVQVEVLFGKDETESSLLGLAERMLAAFLASDAAQPAGTIVGIEEELTGPFIPDVPDVLARLDLVVATGEALIIRDFKTARSRWSADHAVEQADQLLLYGELARPMAPNKPIVLEFVVLTKAKTPAIGSASMRIASTGSAPSSSASGARSSAATSSRRPAHWRAARARFARHVRPGPEREPSDSIDLERRKERMDLLLLIGLGIYFGWHCYRSGKRDGSRQGFGAGRRSKRSR